jgi:hypothetical protein
MRKVLKLGIPNCYKRKVLKLGGVPAMLGAKMILTEKWFVKGVFNVEEFDPDPFMAEIGKYGLPWNEEIDEELPVKKNSKLPPIISVNLM